MLNALIIFIGIIFLLIPAFVMIVFCIDFFVDDKPKKKDEIIEIWFEEIKDDDNVGK